MILTSKHLSLNYNKVIIDSGNINYEIKNIKDSIEHHLTYSDNNKNNFNRFIIPIDFNNPNEYLVLGENLELDSYENETHNNLIIRPYKKPCIKNIIISESINRNYSLFENSGMFNNVLIKDNYVYIYMYVLFFLLCFTLFFVLLI